jgi:hypothetical protein
MTSQLVLATLQFFCLSLFQRKTNLFWRGGWSHASFIIVTFSILSKKKKKNLRHLDFVQILHLKMRWLVLYFKFNNSFKIVKSQHMGSRSHLFQFTMVKRLWHTWMRLFSLFGLLLYYWDNCLIWSMIMLSFG